MVAVALVAGAAIVLARIPLQPLLGATSPFILATPGILVAALFGGVWPAVVISFLGLWVGDRAIILGGGPKVGPGGVAIYFAFAATFVAIVESRRRLMERAKADAERIADMSQRLAKVARLTAMGEMAGALAHEINQPLTAIANYAGAAQRLDANASGAHDSMPDLLKSIAEQAVRAREIIARIRGYVSQSPPALAPQSMGAMFAESVEIARTGSTVGFQLKSQIDLQADKVLADRIQIEQVLINLVRNAAEAMEGHPRREIRVGARLAGDGMVEAWVADSGPGVAPELAERLFQPFVTGKSDGMGIGLAVSRSIIEAHGGTIGLEDGPNGGAVFRFTLKRAGAAL